MGNCCCPPASPSENVEERSGLLQDASKRTASTTDAGFIGAFQDSPEAEGDVRKPSDETKVEVKTTVIKEDKTVIIEQVKLLTQAREPDPSKAQENGPVLEEPKQTEVPSASAGAEPKADCKPRAQEENPDNTATERGPPGSQLCTLDAPLVECATTDGHAGTHPSAAAQLTAVEEPSAAKGDDDVPEYAPEESDQVSDLVPGAEPPTEHIAPEPSRNATNDEKSLDTASGDAAEKPPEQSLVCERASLTDPRLSAEGLQTVDSESDRETSLLQSSLTETRSHSPSLVLVPPLSAAVVSEANSEDGDSTKEPSPQELPVVSQDIPTACLGSDSTPLEDNSAEPASAEPESTNLPATSQSEDTPGPVTLNVVASLEILVQDISEESEPKELREEDAPEVEGEEEEGGGEEEEREEREEGEMVNLADEEEPLTGPSSVVEVLLDPPSKQDNLPGEDVGHSDDDLYQGAEELPPKQVAGPTPLFEITLPKMEARCSLAPAVNILTYSELEWKGNTAKSVLIRKGYKEVSQRFGSLRRVRGDNYCALRATLFQLLSCSTELPAWLQQEDMAMLPKELEAQEGLISQWTFPGECQQGDEEAEPAEQLKSYMELLRNRWQAVAGCSSAEERQRLCERVFQGGEEELGIMEALKLLMLGRAVELHASMQAGGDVPVFCWLLFARDSSECPRTFLSNHLSQVGFSGGLEQVEMFLLGYALQCTIQVYRLYMADTEEFVTYYPDDHKDDWPSVCLVTEDDRHYNVPVGEAVEPSEELASS